MPAPKNTTLKIYVVAKGRTVMQDDIPYGPGQAIDLPEDEGAKLQARGFLLTDDGDVAVAEGGPPTTVGVEIKEG